MLLIDSWSLKIDGGIPQIISARNGCLERRAATGAMPKEKAFA